MGLTTSRYALPYPVAADPNNPPSDLLALANALDTKMSTFNQSAVASRPAAGTSGRFWYATDTKDVSFDTGSVWRTLTGAPIIPVARYVLTTASVASGSALAVISWNSTTFNRNGFASIASGTPKLLAPVTGYYKLRAQARWNIGGTATGAAVLTLRQGPNSDTAGTTIAYAQKSTNWTSAYDNDITVEVETRVSLAAGADVAVWHGATPASTLYNTTDTTFVEMELLSVS